jgi:hypothetical protein
VKITAECGGCFAETHAGYVRQVFDSVNGKGYGFGFLREEITWALPEGWVKFDAIGATYCPKCADEIWPTQSEQ